ncbi:lamin tail domain-containing protein 2 isoform X6 [Hyla sarda]|uniref:lamin tail domain-containing protein 2 isoform X6 n=1 Tax=Hyla sarda TaxID=327740 RepID=UPI0024C3E13A|nr:lamin tail domain-containing protein 2 isoform X6 [Hyla sarda]
MPGRATVGSQAELLHEPVKEIPRDSMYFIDQIQNIAASKSTGLGHMQQKKRTRISTKDSRTASSSRNVQIWASGAKVSQNPPTDLVWKGQVYFRSNPQCITVLSRPNGQPVAFLKNKELSSWSETASSNLCKVQRVIRRPVMEQNNVNSTPSPITTLPRTCAAPEERMSQNMLPYSTYIRPKFYSAFRNLGLAHSEPRPVSVTWQPQRVNTSSPLIRLLVQKTARSKHGFIFLSHIPFTCDILKV